MRDERFGVYAVGANVGPGDGGRCRGRGGVRPGGLVVQATKTALDDQYLGQAPRRWRRSRITDRVTACTSGRRSPARTSPITAFHRPSL